MLLNIINSICRELAKEYVNVPIYIQNVPEGFIRPSFFIDFIIDDTQELNKVLYLNKTLLQIVYFAPMDRQNIVDAKNLYTTYSNIKKILNKGYIVIEDTDRKGKITRLNGGPRDNEIYLNIEISLTDSKEDATSEISQDYEFIQEINLGIKEG